MRKFSRHSQEDSPKRKTRKDKTSAEAKETIINFFRQGDTVFQNKTLKETYREYGESKLDVVSFSTFARLKPCNVDTT